MGAEQPKSTHGEGNKLELFIKPSPVEPPRFGRNAGSLLSFAPDLIEFIEPKMPNINSEAVPGTYPEEEAVSEN